MASAAGAEEVASAGAAAGGASAAGAEEAASAAGAAAGASVFGVQAARDRAAIRAASVKVIFMLGTQCVNVYKCMMCQPVDQSHHVTPILMCFFRV